MQTIFLLGSIDVQFIDAMRTLIGSVYSNAFRSQFNGPQFSKALFDIEMRIDQRQNKFTIADHEVDQHKRSGNDSMYGQKYVQLISTSKLETNLICSLFGGILVVMNDSIKWCVKFLLIITQI